MNPEKKVELIVSLLDSEMNRFWTRFNIFSAVQVGAVLAIASTIKVLVSNIILFRSVLFLLCCFSITGMIAMLRGFDLECSLVKTLGEIEAELQPEDKLLTKVLSNTFLPTYLNLKCCTIFSVICCIFWIAGFIWLEMINFKIIF